MVKNCPLPTEGYVILCELPLMTMMRCVSETGTKLRPRSGSREEQRRDKAGAGGRSRDIKDKLEKICENLAKERASWELCKDYVRLRNSYVRGRNGFLRAM